MTLFDSILAERIPSHATWAAGYVDGAWPSFLAIREKVRPWEHSGRRCVSLTVEGGDHVADFIDIERGAATIEHALLWVPLMRTLRRDPGVYCNLSTWPSVFAAFRDHRIPQPHYWVADWTNRPHLLDGAVACQWASPTTDPALPCDVSEVSPHFPPPFLDDDRGGHRITTQVEKEPTVTHAPATHQPGATPQSRASIGRQAGGGALVGLALSGTLPSISGVNRTAEFLGMLIGGLAFFVAEHYLGDPSTGSTPPTSG